MARLRIAVVVEVITYFTEEVRLKHRAADYAKNWDEVIVSEVRDVM